MPLVEIGGYPIGAWLLHGRIPVLTLPSIADPETQADMRRTIGRLVVEIEDERRDERVLAERRLMIGAH